MSFTAEYDGRCAKGCDSGIHKGDTIERAEAFANGSSFQHFECDGELSVELPTYEKPTKFSGTSLDDMGY